MFRILRFGMIDNIPLIRNAGLGSVGCFNTWRIHSRRFTSASLLHVSYATYYKSIAVKLFLGILLLLLDLRLPLGSFYYQETPAENLAFQSHYHHQFWGKGKEDLTPESDRKRNPSQQGVSQRDAVYAVDATLGTLGAAGQLELPGTPDCNSG
jgi:hypothetical protein